VLYGEADNDTINGGAGDDKIWGGSGNDVIDGWTGADLMGGGDGNDIFIVDNIGDSVVEFQGQGLDLVRSYLTSYQMPDYNDAYTVNSSSDIVTEYSNQGTDLVRSYLTNYYLGAHLENLLLIPNSTAMNGFGNNLNNGMGGNENNNTLTGFGGNDVINGLNGNDYLTGDAGDDIISGGAGNDDISGGGYTSNSGDDDSLYGQGGADRFILSTVGYGVHYLGTGYAIIRDFNRSEGDKVLLRGSSSQYTLTKNANVTGGAGLDTVIQRNGDWIGVIADTTSFSLNGDATYV
jgi:Ca2+-binding RTX toxin-like protein